jgi:hypothetical protein
MQALLQMQPINLGGVAQGMLWLTPSDVQRVPELRKGPHWEFTLTPLDTAKQVAPHNHGVYLGGDPFPPVCADCGSPATRVGLLEVGLPVQSLSSKLRVSTKADAQKVFQALRDKRIWYAVPFCAQHSLGSKSISMSDGHNVDKTWKVTTKIADPDFGRGFGELNELKGVWIHPTLVGDVKMHDPHDKDALPGNWLLRIALLRLPLFATAAAACAYFIWTFIQQFRLSGGSLDLCSAGMIPAAIALVAAIALLFAGYQVGHFPKAGKPPS